MLVFGNFCVADSEFVPLKEGDTRVSESQNDHGGITLNRIWKIDADTGCIERIVMNADKTVRGRVITTFRSGKPIMSLAYKGIAYPWFTEHWTWLDERGHTIERRSFDGELINQIIFPSEENGVVRSLDAEGKEMSDEHYKALSDEVADILF